ncbi:hypothetical protein NE237_003375 [Protea cynaroides]|uniref:Uncharacterized protein n=1 Tax=Protea cynaroides TaxID=273540 RepID=A0A9Q0KH92_9MAGN|nr:hypothetical protein NE237_003375 [Protea cynaroides]
MEGLREVESGISESDIKLENYTLCPDGFSLSWSRVKKGRLVIGGLLSVNVGGGAGRPIRLALNTSLGWGLTKVCPPVRLAAKIQDVDIGFDYEIVIAMTMRLEVLVHKVELQTEDISIITFVIHHCKSMANKKTRVRAKRKNNSCVVG